MLWIFRSREILLIWKARPVVYLVCYWRWWPMCLTLIEHPVYLFFFCNQRYWKIFLTDFQGTKKIVSDGFTWSQGMEPKIFCSGIWNPGAWSHIVTYNNSVIVLLQSNYSKGYVNESFILSWVFPHFNFNFLFFSRDPEMWFQIFHVCSYILPVHSQFK